MRIGESDCGRVVGGSERCNKYKSKFKVMKGWLMRYSHFRMTHTVYKIWRCPNKVRCHRQKNCLPISNKHSLSFCCRNLLDMDTFSKSDPGNCCDFLIRLIKFNFHFSFLISALKPFHIPNAMPLEPNVFNFMQRLLNHYFMHVISAHQAQWAVTWSVSPRAYTHKQQPGKWNAASQMIYSLEEKVLVESSIKFVLLGQIYYYSQITMIFTVMLVWFLLIHWFRYTWYLVGWTWKCYTCNYKNSS